MWAQVLVSHCKFTHQNKAKNKVSHSKAKVTRVEMIELMKKKNNQSKPSQTPIAQIITSLQKWRKLQSLHPERKLRCQRVRISSKSPL